MTMVFIDDELTNKIKEHIKAGNSNETQIKTFVRAAIREKLKNDVTDPKKRTVVKVINQGVKPRDLIAFALLALFLTVLYTTILIVGGVI